MIRRPPISTLFPYTTLLPIFAREAPGFREDLVELPPDERLVTLAGNVKAGEELALKKLLVLGWSALTRRFRKNRPGVFDRDRKSTRLNSSHANISYAVFCLKK